MQDDLARFLAQTPLFSTLTEADLAAVLPGLVSLRVDTDDVIFEEGDIGNAWYVVRSGEVVVRKRMANGPDHDLALLDPGECFGEMSLLDDSPRLASVLATRPSELIAFPRDAFQRVVDEGGPLSSRLLRAMAGVLCARQRELTHILSDLVDDPDELTDPARRALLALWRAPVA